MARKRQKQIHLTGFMLYCPAPHMIMSWVYPEHKMTAGKWYDTEYWASIAKTLERGKFDTFFFADGWAGGVNDPGIKYAIQFPTHDPASLVPYLSAVAPQLSYAITMSTTFYEPYMVARKMSTLDHITKGKIGWNIVCSISSAEAKNFGMDELPPHDLRYDRADEFMEVCHKLWNSWEPGALLMDMERKIFADPEKIHKINHVGKWFKCQGPLTVAPSPQGRPYLFQAGSSERGREFAIKHADCIFAIGAGAEQMRTFSDDIKARADRAGRNPDEIKIIWGAQPIIADSEQEARNRMKEIRARIPLEASLALMSGHFNIDLSKFDVDTPVTELKDFNVSGTVGMFESYLNDNSKVTLRDIASTYLSGSDDNPMAGTGDQVAEYMIHLIEEGGGDGFQITPSYYAPQFYEDVVNNLIPALQSRGAYRTEYDGSTLRDYMNG